MGIPPLSCPPPASSTSPKTPGSISLKPTRPRPAARLVAAGRLPRLTVGTTLTPPDRQPRAPDRRRRQPAGRRRRPGQPDPVRQASLTTGLRLPAGETTLYAPENRPGPGLDHPQRQGQPGASGRRRRTGHRRRLRRVPALCLTQGHILPDEPGELKALLVDLALTQGFDLVVTTGGTGLSPRDSTPEATLAVVEKRLPGFETAMLMASLAKTHHAMLSRAVAGTLGQAIVVNVPGSPKAVRETLAAILPAIPHGLDKLRGDPADCAQL